MARIAAAKQVKAYRFGEGGFPQKPSKYYENCWKRLTNIKTKGFTKLFSQTFILGCPH